MKKISIQRRRTGWDLVLGALVVIGGLIVLGEAVIATAVTALFIGWLAFVTGVLGVVAALFEIGKDSRFFSGLIAGALMTVLGIFILRNPLFGAAVITAMLGFVFLVSGIVRLVAGFERSSARWALLISGLASIVLGLIVLFNPAASLTLLGVLLGIQLLIDGLTMVIFGRVRVDIEPAGS